MHFPLRSAPTRVDDLGSLVLWRSIGVSLPSSCGSILTTVFLLILIYWLYIVYKDIMRMATRYRHLLRENKRRRHARELRARVVGKGADARVLAGRRKRGDSRRGDGDRSRAVRNKKAEKRRGNIR